MKFLMKIGEKVSKPIKIDLNTSLVSMEHLACLCVEVDMNKPLLSKFKLRRIVYQIQYEGLHLICFECGKYDHSTEYCSLRNNFDNIPEVGHQDGRQKEDRPADPAVLEDFGDWMVVKRERKNQRKRPGPSNLGMDKNTRLT